MNDIFISYCSEDRPVAEKLAGTLREDGWEVFWDRRIAPGAEWNEEIQRALNDARCVIVLWSSSSITSFWVRGEATHAYERGVYTPIRIDETEPPRLFRHVQTPSIVSWVRGEAEQELLEFKLAIRSRIGELRMYGNLEKVSDGEPVTQRHLHIVHSCWRVDKPSAFGKMPYQIHLIIFGHSSALSRVESVEYCLPGYPAGHDRQIGGPKERLFELKELANGFCIAQAHVTLNSQPPSYPKVIELTRLINMSEHGPFLLDDFIRRRRSITNT